MIVFMKISVVTASYNYEEYIKKTIQSVLDQTYQDWELIIIDDGSKDNSLSVINSYCEKDKRIKLYTHENNINKGLKETIQLGISKAQGEWIVFLESDDLIAPDYMSKKVKIAEQNKDVNLIFNDCEFFGDDNRVRDFNIALNKTRTILSNRTYPRDMFYDFYLSNKIFTFSCVMAKRDDLFKIDYNANLDYLLDWWMWIQLAGLGQFYYMPEKLTRWRLHSSSYINNSKYKSPLDLQTKAYLHVFSKTGNFKILPFIMFAHPLWHLRKFKRELRQAIVSRHH